MVAWYKRYVAVGILLAGLSGFVCPGMARAEEAGAASEKVAEAQKTAGEMTLTKADLEAIEKVVKKVVKKVVGKKVRPILRELAKAQEEKSEPTFKDIFGGIGYILGLVGVAMYFSSRRKN